MIFYLSLYVEPPSETNRLGVLIYFENAQPVPYKLVQTAHFHTKPSTPMLKRLVLLLGGSTFHIILYVSFI